MVSGVTNFPALLECCKSCVHNQETWFVLKVDCKSSIFFVVCNLGLHVVYTDAIQGKYP